MDANTGHIHFNALEEEIKKKALVPIPTNELEDVVNMNRKQRRAWAAMMRRKENPGAKRY